MHAPLIPHSRIGFLLQHRIPSLLACMVIGAVSCSLTAQASFKALTLQQAAVQAAALKHCPKKAVGLIESATAVGADGKPITQPGGPIYLVFTSENSIDASVVGPLDRTPTPAQLDAFKGQRMCVTT